MALIETKRSNRGVESVAQSLDQHSMSAGVGTAARTPEKGEGAGVLFIALSHSCYPGPGSLFMPKLSLSAGSKTLMVSMRACAYVY